MATLINMCPRHQSSYFQMIGVSNHLQNVGSMKPFSEGEPGSLGIVNMFTTPLSLVFLNKPMWSWGSKTQQVSSVSPKERKKEN